MIGVIVAACVVFLALCGAVFWLLRKMRRNKAMSAKGTEATGAGAAGAGAGALAGLATAAGTSEKGSRPNVVTDNRDIASIHSSTPMVMHSGSQRSSPVRDKAGALMQHAEARQSSSILSSTDALMIADTFRQFMRKPEWTEHHEEEEDDGLQSQWDNKQQQQQQQRGDEMLRRQLAEDGTPLQQVQKRPSPLKNDDEH